MRHQTRIVREIGQFHEDLDRCAQFVLAETVPEIVETQISVTFRQARIEHELERTDEVALPTLFSPTTTMLSPDTTSMFSKLAKLEIPIRDIFISCLVPMDLAQTVPSVPA